MKFNQMKFQKTIVISAFVLAILTFVYAYTFSTPFYPLSFGDPAKYLNEVDKTFFASIQPFNRMIATLAVVFFLVSLLLFLSFTQKRRRYYIFNYIAIGCYAAFGFGYSIYAFIYLIDYSIKYHNIDFNAVVVGLEDEIRRNKVRYDMIPEADRKPGDYENYLQRENGFKAKIVDFQENFQKETIMFILGYILFALIIIVSVLLIVNCIIKAKNLKKEDAAFAEEDARIYAAREAHNKALEQAMNDEEAKEAENAENVEQTENTEALNNTEGNQEEAKLS